MAKENLQERILRDTFRRESTVFSSSVNLNFFILIKTS